MYLFIWMNELSELFQVSWTLNGPKYCDIPPENTGPWNVREYSPDKLQFITNFKICSGKSLRKAHRKKSNNSSKCPYAVCMYVCMNEWMNEWIRLDMNNSSHLWGCWHLQVGCWVHVGCHGDNASVVSVWFQACDDCTAWVCRDGLGFSSFTVVRDQDTAWVCRDGLCFRNTDGIFSVHRYLNKGVVRRVCGNAVQTFSFSAEGQQLWDLIHSCRMAPSHWHWC